MRNEGYKLIVLLLILLVLGFGYFLGKRNNSKSVDTASATKNCMDIWEYKKSQWGDTGYDLDSWNVAYDKKNDKCVAGHNDLHKILVVDILSGGNFVLYWSDFQFIGSEEQKLKEWSDANDEYMKYFGN